ncbi:RNA polymerase sigma factor [Arachidicoccus sp.]|uniref:RNA polymerase sigma factor n=1 Tax=Arachidicoccus sp. TaxID=1872624 RepID=UPI003D1F0D20
MFQDFFSLWNERLYFYFLKKTKDGENARELTQLTFIKFWEYRSSLSDEYSLETQLFRKAKFVFIDWLRKEAILRKRKEAEAEFYNTSPEDTIHYFEAEKLHNALEQLPPMRRRVIELSHLRGYAYKEIAEKLNISVKTVDNHIYQALKQLRKIMSIFFL